MNGIWLDFEKPIIELEKKIEDLQALGGLDDEIGRMRAQAEKLKKRIYSNLSRWQRVQLARHPRRPYPADIISRIIDDFVELHGDRHFRDDAAIIAGFGRLEGHGIAVIAEQKGRDTKERMRRNFGMPHPEGYRKALRIMKMAARFNVPILTLVDTQGAYPGVGAEERGQAEAIAVNLFECAVMPVPIIVVIVGEGGSGGALAIAVGDRILMLEYAIYSVITPEGCASILWRDSSRAKDAAEALKITAPDLLSFKVVDDIIPEPVGGAHMDFDATAQNVKSYVLRYLEELKTIPPSELVAQRVDKFRRMGVYRE